MRSASGEKGENTDDFHDGGDVKRLDALTPDQASQIAVYRERYRAIGLTCGLTNRPLAERAIRELERGDFEQVLAKGSEGYLLMVATGDEGMLTTMCAKSAKLGLVLLDMQKAAAETAAVF